MFLLSIMRWGGGSQYFLEFLCFMLQYSIQAWYNNQDRALCDKK